MTKNELKIKIAKVLGVSSSEKELAYEILLSKISEQLHPNLTLKIPSIGYFQLRSEGKADSQSPDSIVFIPFSNEFSKESENLYLILEVAPRKKNSMEFDSSVFSIGVGKPLVPLYNKEDFKDSETSYAILRKSIEERVNELISESSQLENFNMWDGFVQAGIQSSETAQSHEDTLKELTSDLNFDSPHGSPAEEIYSGEPDQKNLDDIQIDLLTASLLMEEDFNPADKETAVTETEKPADEEPPVEGETEEKIEDGIPEEEVSETEPEAPAEEIIDNLKEKIIEENAEPEKEDSSWNFDFAKEEEEKIEWNWGDNLKEEFGLGKGEDEESKYDIVDEELELDETKEEEEPSIEAKSTKDLFDELDSTIKKELTTEIEFQPETKTTQPRSKRYDFIEERLPYDREEYVPPTVVSAQAYTGATGNVPDSYDDRKYSSLSKSIFWVFSAFIVVAALILYFFVFSKEKVQQRPETAAITDTAQNNEAEQQMQIGTAEPAATNNQPVGPLPEEDNFPRTATLEVKDKDELNKPETVKNQKTETAPVKKQTVTQAKTQPAETKVADSIFFDGAKYNVQISSWRNKAKADQEVARLKRLGHDAFEYEVNIPQKGGIWYRVRVGGFNSQQEAENFLNQKNF